MKDLGNGGFILDQPEEIAHYRLLVLKGRMKVELLTGFRDRMNVFAVVKREFNLRGSKQKVYDAFCKMHDIEDKPNVPPDTAP